MKKNNKFLNLAVMGMLIALIILFAFTPIGYLRVGTVEITFLTIPVIVGAVLLGPGYGALLGFIFGLTSFAQCFGMSAFGALMLGVNPVLTAVVCIVPRTLMGLCTGLIFKGVQKVDKTKWLSYGTASLSGALLNTLFFMTTLILCFWNTSTIQDMAQSWGATGILSFCVIFCGINALIEALVCATIGTAVTKAVALVQDRMIGSKKEKQG